MSAPIVVVGATGTIGRSLIDDLVRSGFPVVAVAPEQERLEALRREHPEGAVTTLPHRVHTDQDAARLAADLRSLARPPAGVVVAISSPAGRGRVLDDTIDELRACVDQTLLPQLALARHLIPLLVESGRNGSYVMLGGPGSEMPWAGYGHRSIAMAATRMLAHVLHDEARPLDVRVHLLSIDSPVRNEQAGAHECPEWPTTSGIARRIVQLLDRTRAAEPPQAVVSCGRSVAGFRNVAAFLQSLKTPIRP